MRAATFNAPHSDGSPFLKLDDVARPTLRDGYSLLRVVACGVCRTDLHIVTGELPPMTPVLIAGHQIVGEIVEGPTTVLAIGRRVGVSWLGGTDGTCWYCRHDKENLCDSPTFTGYSVDGGYAEFVLVRSDFLFPLPDGMEDAAAAPFALCGNHWFPQPPGRRC